VTQPVQPPEALVSGDNDIRDLYAEVHTADKVTVTGYGASHFLAKVDSSWDLGEIHFNEYQTPTDYTLSKHLLTRWRLVSELIPFLS
jgi:hypothetical protein